MKILAIDPGPEKSAWLVYDHENKTICDFDIFQNEDLVLWLEQEEKEVGANIMVVEFISAYGMPVGKTTFETCYWVGRFIQAFKGATTHRIYRYEIKQHLCNSMRAKDANIRQVLIDRFGGTKEKAIGTKKKPGPLYGIKKDLWSALAIAVTYSETSIPPFNKI